MAKAFQKHLLIVRLEKIEFFKKGRVGKKNGSHALTANFVWPRAAVQAKAYSRLIEVGGNARVYGESEWREAVICKETVQAPSALELSVTVPLSDAAVSKIGRAAVKAALGAAADAVEDAIAAPFGRAAGTAVDAVAALVAASSEEKLGEGCILLDDEFVSNGGVRTIELFAKKDFKSETTASNGRSRKYRTVIAKGEKVAEATLRFTELDG